MCWVVVVVVGVEDAVRRRAVWVVCGREDTTWRRQHWRAVQDAEVGGIGWGCVVTVEYACGGANKERGMLGLVGIPMVPCSRRKAAERKWRRRRLTVGRQGMTVFGQGNGLVIASAFVEVEAWGQTLTRPNRCGCWCHCRWSRVAF